MKVSLQIVIAILTLAAGSDRGLAALVSTIRIPSEGIQPQAVSDSHGVVHLVYFQGDPAAGNLFYCRTTEGKLVFSPPLKVNSQPNSAIAIGSIRGAQLALGRNGRLHVAWNGTVPKGGGYLDAPMCYTRLNDTGDAFEPQRNLITSARGLDGGGSVGADQAGNVFVTWHAPRPGNTNGEAGRSVFIAKSTDDGRTFAPEIEAAPEAQGACGCCGMKAFCDHLGNLFALYRTATDLTNRNEVLLLSRDHGAAFKSVYEHPWNIGSCPMSSAFLSESSRGVLAAAESHNRVFFVRVDPQSGKVSPPVSPENHGKYPVAIANERGETLLCWIEGSSWGKGGAVAWQVYLPDGQPAPEHGRVEGVPAWSFATAFVSPAAGEFVILY